VRGEAALRQIITMTQAQFVAGSVCHAHLSLRHRLKGSDFIFFFI
jgi:hypothetical protein